VTELNNDDDRFTSVDTLNILTLFILTALVAFFRRPLGEHAVRLVGIFASLLFFIVLSAFLAPRRPLWRFIHGFSSLLIIIGVFNSIEPIIDCTSPGRWDVFFASMDARYFGSLAGDWRSLLGRPAWFTDIAYVAYLGYYIAPVALGLILYWRHPVDAFRSFVFTVALTFYASYVGYFAFPTEGPRVALELESAVIGGGAFSHAARLFIDFAERTHVDAFPSGHAAGALVCLYFARRTSPLLFAIYVPVAIGIIFSTVYLHYHYVIDVVAGAVLASGCLATAPVLERLLAPREMMRWVTVRLGLR